MAVFVHPPDGATQSLGEWEDFCGGLRQAVSRSLDVCRGQEANEVMDRLAGAVKLESDRASSRCRREWCEYLHEDLEAGSRHAHRFTRPTSRWSPSVVLDDDGNEQSDVTALLQAETDKFQALWQPANKMMCVPPIGPMLPKQKFSPEAIRQASKEFPHTTASTFDGFHVRHYALLSAAALEVLASILYLSELLGELPAQIAAVILTMLSKPTGGYRPIGVFPSPYRLWGRLSRSVADEWERKHERTFSPALSTSRRSTLYGDRPYDWRQEMRATRRRWYCFGTLQNTMKACACPYYGPRASSMNFRRQYLDWHSSHTLQRGILL